MEYKRRRYPLFSACGLNCGLCPGYHTDAASRCPGCGGVDFSSKHPACGVLSCCQRHGLEYCYLCGEYPCKKYENADRFDSFITHKNQMADSGKAERIGLDAYMIEQNTKIELLKDLLTDFNDGRRKSFFCLAVNLLDLQDIQTVMEQIQNEIKPDTTLKEKSAAIVRLFQAMAEKRKISLHLRKKPRS
ncbi:MAG TPA: DUF3795 domain-containing protein [Spirochaetota bacterium]|nr:DUF3795 domain-containing protein [Spirochaetota bacterium]